MKRTIIRGKTNDGDVVKQYCFLVQDHSKGYEKSVIVHRLILTDNYKDYLLTGHTHLKTFKGKGLFSKSFSMKVSSLIKLLEFAEDESEDPPKKIFQTSNEYYNLNEK